jgi:hypothetical protein
MTELLKKLYSDPETGFQSADKLYKKAKEFDQTITRKQVAEFMAENRTDLLHKERRKPTRGMPIIGTLNSYQADLIFYFPFKAQNKNYSTILTAININTKYAFAIPVKSKGSGDMTEAMQKLIGQVMVKYGKFFTLETDNGKEFTNHSVQKLLEENKIAHRTGQEGEHRFTGIIERFNRTIKGMISKYMTENNTTNWFDILSTLVDNYNSTDHSTLEGYNLKTSKPKLLGPKEEKKIIDKKVIQAFALVENKFKVGDRVLIPELKGLFEKEGQRWVDEIYTIKELGLSKATLINPEGNTMRRKYRITDLQRAPTDLVKPSKPRKSNTNEMGIGVKEAKKHTVKTDSDRVIGVKEAKRLAKVKRIIRKEGVDESNIIKEPRVRKQTERLKY